MRRVAERPGPLRVLHVAHGWPPEDLGGTELYAAALADAQRRAGALVAHWTPASASPALSARGLRFRETFTRPEAEAAFGVACHAAFPETRGARPAGPDILHVHHLTGASMGIPGVARGLGARVVFTLHDAWLACARGQLVDRSGAQCAGPAVDRCARCLSTAVWAPLPPALADRLPLRRDLIRARAEALSSLRAHVDLFLSPSRHLPARLGIPCTWLPLPLLRPVLPAPPSPPGPVRFLFLGGLLPTKGPDVALEAFARLPAGAATLRLVGPSLPYDGRTTYADKLRARAAEVPGASLTGPCPADHVPALFAEADVLLFPSTWEENSPLVLREAGAAGLRIVASDLPGVTEVLGADRAVRVEPGSVEAWRRALAAEVRQGRARVSPLVTEPLDAHAARVLGLYGRLLEESPAREGSEPTRRDVPRAAL
ncbi:MAG: glycosyltransferase [Pseudomonadota bacterium]|nr:glycosyltransferase [Pseudomonadota bacterium]